jgi:6,7-dimethyl-8-ribityllumazine synthase
VNRQIDDSSENVLSEWTGAASDADGSSPGEDGPAWGAAPAEQAVVEEPVVEETVVTEPVEEEGAAEEPDAAEQPEAPEPELPEVGGTEAISVELSREHAAGELEIPDGYAVLEGEGDGARRAVGLVVARFNGQVTSRLLSRALEELETAGVRREAITVMVVPGAFELPLAATALAKTRRFACVVALGCVIRGDTPHFDYIASEAASGLQLAALETGVPVSFGVLTLDEVAQADARIEKGAEAVRTALEMADVFAHLRAAASR